MRIAVFIKRTTFHKNHGGLETQNKALCEGLAKNGHSVVVFSPKNAVSDNERLRAKARGLPAENKIVENEVEYLFIDAVYRMGIFFERFEAHLSYVLKKVVPFIKIDGVFSDKGKEDWLDKSFAFFHATHDENNFDIVLNQSAVGLSIIKRKHELNIPVISISHGTIVGEYLSRIQGVSIKSLISPRVFLSLVRDTTYVLVNFFGRQRQFIHGSDKIIAVSTAVKRNLVNETFISADKIEVIHNGISSQKFEEKLKDMTNVARGVSSGEAPKIVFVGRILREKGIFKLLESVRLLKNEGINFNLNFLGDGEDFEELKVTLLRLQLEDVVKLFGNVTPNVVISTLHESDIFVLPTLRVEGFPMSLVEAMFAGLPALASNIGGNSDAVDDTKTGYLVEPGNIKQLTTRLKDLILDENLRKQLGRNAKIKAQNEFTLDVMIKKYEKVISEVLEK